MNFSLFDKFYYTFSGMCVILINGYKSAEPLQCLLCLLEEEFANLHFVYRKKCFRPPAPVFLPCGFKIRADI
jgi:hypothetical protein